ncbi:unnamed protein product [Adineta ricciae]|uniref:Uncharacterized protein n=1 Tax=Adineta ricciae TaxID=249248 RepID=A0A814EF51_ADIRI|nr:unnamed protein product [Adineta ricciae]CAF0965552.1 unnamed protein product [Adineta ricciae]
MEEQKRHWRIYPVIKFAQGIAFTILVFAIILAIYLITLYHTRLTPFVNYAIVFDAGSSHTEMFVYYWPADKSDGLGTTSSVNQLFTCHLDALEKNDTNRIGGTIKLKAISDFEQNLDLLDDYFEPCLSKAIKEIPSTRHRSSPVFLGATAGMRLSRLRNATTADRVLETIREVFANSPFQFVVARQVRILTGIEEAIDGWITTNVLLEKFKHRHTKKKVLAKKELDTDMVGVLDLGGASTQITFTYNQTKDDEPIPKEFTTNITLFDTIYSPYAHSYLCWGKNEALKRHRARLVNAAINTNRTTFTNSRILIRDPCFARGANETLTTKDIFRSPCTANEREKFNSFLNRSTLTFTGSGNATQCRERLISLFDAKRNDKTVNCSHKADYCTFDHTFQPTIPSKIQFIGLSGYYYVFNNLAYKMDPSKTTVKEQYQYKDFSPEEISNRLNSVCETQHAVLYEQEGMDNKTESFKRHLCFDGWYMWLLLTHAIGFKSDDLNRLSFANTVQTGKVGWTLGYMINQTNYIPAEFRERIITKNRFVGWLISSLSLICVTLIFLVVTSYVYCRQKPKSSAEKNHGLMQKNEQEVLT